MFNLPVTKLFQDQQPFDCGNEALSIQSRRDETEYLEGSSDQLQFTVPFGPIEDCNRF